MRGLAALVLAAAVAGCVPPRPFVEASRDPWPALAARVDSLVAADRPAEALLLARRARSLARAWREPAWRVREADALARSLERQASLPLDGQRAVAESERQLSDGRLDASTDSLAAAEVHARLAWTLRHTWLGPHDVRTAEAALALGEADFALARVEDGEARATDAAAGFVAELGTAHPYLAAVEDLRGRLAKNYSGRAGSALALRHYGNALRVLAATEGPTSLAFAKTLQNLANVHRVERRPALAFALFRGAYDARRARLGPVDDDVAATLGGMAFLRASEGRWDEVERFAREALAATPPSAAPGSSRSVRLALLGRALHQLGRDREAVGVLREAVAVRESVWARSPRDEGSSVVAGLGTYRDLAMALAADGRGEDAFEQLARGSSRLLSNRLLGTDSARVDPWRGVLERVSETLADDEAMVTWASSPSPVIAGNDPMWGCVVRHGRPVRWVRLDRVTSSGPRTGGTRDVLWGELIATARWPRRVEDAHAASAMARRMWREWFAKLEPELDGVAKLVVCAPDLVAGGPLGVLQDDRGRWLGERFAISYSPSALLFVHERERASRDATRAKAALLVGDPAYAPGDPERWARLPGSRDEMRDIAARWPVTTTLAGSEARVSSLRALAASGSLAGYGLLHFSAHTAIDARHPLDAAIVLAPDAPGDARGSRLLAREVASQWKLDADLVCLAGCQSSNGMASASEGSLGLQEAFLAAGARSLLVSVWAVDDEATSHLMRAFYAKLDDPALGGDRAAALAAAQAELRAFATPDGRHPYAHPAYWGPFVLVGDPGGAPAARVRPRAGSTSGSRAPRG